MINRNKAVSSIVSVRYCQGECSLLARGKARTPRKEREREADGQTGKQTDADRQRDRRGKLKLDRSVDDDWLGRVIKR